MPTLVSESRGHRPTVVFIQVLSGIICIFLIIYPVLSIYRPLSLLNIFGSVRFQLRRTDVNRIINNNQRNESFICDNATANRTANVTSFEKHRLHALRPYCDIVPTPRNKWIPASRYTESDIVFLIFTGASFYHGRATAIRDTWLSRVTHKYFFSSTPYPALPVTVIEGAGEDYKSNMKKVYLGMQTAYREHNQTAKFYYVAGCDTFINVPHLLKRLNNFNDTQPLVIGGHRFDHVCYIKKNATRYWIPYPSGGAGFFLSARLMEMMYSKLTPFFENDWPIEKQPYSDVAITCLAHSLGVKPSFVPGFWAFSPEKTLNRSGRTQLHADSEPNTFHYIQPESMYNLDEFYIFQYIDRLANDNNLNELVKFTRQFVATHYELLRIKNKECTLPPIRKTRQ